MALELGNFRIFHGGELEGVIIGWTPLETRRPSAAKTLQYKRRIVKEPRGCLQETSISKFRLVLALEFNFIKNIISHTSIFGYHWHRTPSFKSSIWFLPVILPLPPPLPMASSELTWINVAISLSFVLFDIGISTVFRLGIGVSLLIAGLRCVGQLALVATVLNKVFETRNPWLVSLICCAFVLPPFNIQVDSHLLSLVMLNFLGTFETGTSTLVVPFCLTSWPPSAVINKSSKRFRYMVHRLLFKIRCVSYFISSSLLC